jgi:hypothetical protein
MSPSSQNVLCSDPLSLVPPLLVFVLSADLVEGSKRRVRTTVTYVQILVSQSLRS